MPWRRLEDWKSRHGNMNTGVIDESAMESTNPLKSIQTRVLAYVRVCERVMFVRARTLTAFF